MKILLPVNEQNIESGVCVSFGRSPYFLLWDTNTNNSTYVENPGASSSGGAGIKAAQAVVDHKSDVLIVPRIGKNASDVIDVAGIKIYKSTQENIIKCIDQMKNGELEILTDIHPGFHNHGES